MRPFLRTRSKSFRYAFSGWWYVLRTQRNTWIHAVISVTAILLMVWLKLPLTEMAVIVLTIAIVWTAEILNTALETIVDLASPETHPLAKVGKDVGAAAVLIASLAAVIVGVLILGPALAAKVGLVLPGS